MSAIISGKDLATIVKWIPTKGTLRAPRFSIEANGRHLCIASENSGTDCDVMVFSPVSDERYELPRYFIDELAIRLFKTLPSIDFKIWNEDNELHLQSVDPGWSFQINMSPSEELHPWNFTATKMAADTFEAMRQVIPVTSNDQLRPEMRYILLDADRVVATNGHQLLRITTQTHRSGPPLLVMPEAVQIAAKAKQAVTYGSSTHPYDFLWVEDRVLVRYLGATGTYAKWQAVIPETTEFTVSYVAQ